MLQSGTRDRLRTRYDQLWSETIGRIRAGKVEGVTASPGTVMIQGFFENEELNDLRDALRRQLGMRGLGAGVDQRYRLESAHMTVARFRAPLCDSERFATVLEQARQRSFGATTVRNLSLVESDWYMSHGATETVKRYRLVPG